MRCRPFEEVPPRVAASRRRGVPAPGGGPPAHRPTGPTGRLSRCQDLYRAPLFVAVTNTPLPRPALHYCIIIFAIMSYTVKFLPPLSLATINHSPPNGRAVLVAFFASPDSGVTAGHATPATQRRALAGPWPGRVHRAGKIPQSE